MSYLARSARFISVFFISITSTLLFADELTANKLEPVIVTANRTAQTADEALASVSVITREDIERDQSQDLFEILRSQTGIDLARTGGTGNVTSLFMRGTNSNHTLVLVDGVRASSATTGTFSIQNMDTSMIERIEIVRGPRASLYGSDAIGGVIQIFTRKPKGAFATVKAGSFGTKELGAGYGGGDKVKYHVNLHVKDIDGFSSTNKNNPFSFDPDKDGLKSESFDLSLETPLTSKMKITFNSWYATSESDFDVGVSDNINKTGNLKLDHHSSDTWNQSFSLGHSVDEIQTSSVFFASNISSERTSFDWQHDLIVGTDQLITAGLNYYEDDSENIDTLANSVVFNQDIDNKAVYFNWQGQLAKHDLQAGFRFDDHSNFGSETTGQLAWGRKFDRVKVRAGYGTAFKAPSLNELFHPGFPPFIPGDPITFAGNPALGPETSETIEIGALHSFGKSHSMDVSIFDTRIDNLIAFQGVNSQAINIGEASMRGIELTYKIKKKAWTIQHNITFQKATNEDNNMDLLRRADRKMSFNVSRAIKSNGNVGAELLFSSDREDISTTLPGYGILNMSINYPVSKHVMLLGRIENLTDKQYELVSTYNTADRSAFIALQYKN